MGLSLGAFCYVRSVLDTVKRIFKKEFKVTDNIVFKIGEEHMTSKVGQAAACHGPGPIDGCVVVFSKHWVSVPISFFHT